MTHLKTATAFSTVDLASTVHGHGHRLTPQRHVILEAVRKAGGHLTPDTVYTRVHAKNPAINRATIYRTLDFLCEMRLVVAMQWGGQKYYEAASAHPHHHLVCRNCNRIVQIDHGLIETLTEEVQKKHHFKVDMDHVALFGLCAECRRPGKQDKI
jgi:Fur family ferric uptake transcriptional regulator